MRRACALLGLLALLLGACGKYGAPIRSRPPQSAARAPTNAPTATAPAGGVPDPQPSDPDEPNEPEPAP